MSSNIMSRPINVSKFGLIFAGAQKNIGISGVTLVIVRDDLLGKVHPLTPSVWDYKIIADNNSMYNTPPTDGYYITGLVLDWIEKKGGVQAFDKKASALSTKLYSFIDDSNFYTCTVKRAHRSRMNVVFRIKNTELENLFIKEAEKEGFLQLSGHRSIGGCRVSLYNAVPEEAVDALIEFMKDFQQKHQS